MFLYFIAALLFMWFSYLFAFGSRKPLFIGGRSAKLRNIMEIVSSNTGLYFATPWSPGGHLHTILAHILRTRPKVNYRTEHLTTPDGGCLRLDWAEGERTREESKRNIVLILPGLTGTSREQYVLHFVKVAQHLGYEALVMNYRGSFQTVQTYRFNCAANTDDLDFLLEHINERAPASKVCAVGVSLGGIILSNYLVKSKSQKLLCAAFVVSIPWDLFVASRSLEKPITCFLFNHYLTRKLQHYYQLNVAALKSLNIAVPGDVEINASKANTIRQFDDAVVAPMFGYQDVDDYYTDASVSMKPFETVKTPLLCLNAVDDPFSPDDQIPVERIKQCENVAMILTHTGGHVGFLEGLFPIGGGYMCRVYREYIKAVFDN